MREPDELKNAGLKATLPRLKVLSLFENSVERHLSAEDVYRMLPGGGIRRRGDRKTPENGGRVTRLQDT